MFMECNGEVVIMGCDDTGIKAGHRELRVYQAAFNVTSEIYDLFRIFPSEERPSPISQ